MSDVSSGESAPVIDLGRLLDYTVMSGSSDLHLKVPSAPMTRLHGELTPVPRCPRLTPDDTRRFLKELIGESEGKRAEFEERGEVDLSFARPKVGRFRVNAFKQRGSVSIVMRVVPAEVPSLDELGLPGAVSQLAKEERGIVLVTGTTGSGKSTTLAAMINQINQTTRKHVVTIEDPIELLHRDQRSIINQREVGDDTGSFADALRRVLRQDPDVIMIGEIRDLATMETALSAAETGHLVFSTLHTLDATETINRAIGFFPPHQQSQVRLMLAGTLRGIISQRLVPRCDISGRVAACEVLVATHRARDFIVDPEETGRLHEVIRDGEFYGMQTFDQCLFDHVTQGRVSLDVAMKAASSPHDFKLMLETRAARRTVEDFAPA